MQFITVYVSFEHGYIRYLTSELLHWYLHFDFHSKKRCEIERIKRVKTATKSFTVNIIQVFFIGNCIITLPPVSEWHFLQLFWCNSIPACKYNALETLKNDIINDEIFFINTLSFYNCFELKRSNTILHQEKAVKLESCKIAPAYKTEYSGKIELVRQINLIKSYCYTRIHKLQFTTWEKFCYIISIQNSYCMFSAANGVYLKICHYL